MVQLGSYNTIIPSPLSAARDNSRQLAGGNARARSSGGIICYNTFRRLHERIWFLCGQDRMILLLLV